jgi:hypothetical protein
MPFGNLNPPATDPSSEVMSVVALLKSAIPVTNLAADPQIISAVTANNGLDGNPRSAPEEISDNKANTEEHLGHYLKRWQIR